MSEPVDVGAMTPDEFIKFVQSYQAAHPELQPEAPPVPTEADQTARQKRLELEVTRAGQRLMDAVMLYCQKRYEHQRLLKLGETENMFQVAQEHRSAEGDVQEAIKGLYDAYAAALEAA